MKNPTAQNSQNPLNPLTQHGFTLIELIVVIGILVFLIAVVLVAIDPGRRFAESRNAQRWQEASSILSAVLTYQADNDGTHLTAVTNLTGDLNYIIGTDGSGCDSGCTQAGTTQAACANLSGLVDTYIASIPIDPDTTTWGTGKTGYYIVKAVTSGRITIGACVPQSEGGTTPTISVTR